MHRLPAVLSAVSALALTGSLVSIAPAASASDFDCDDPAHPINVGRELDVAIGTQKARTGDLVVYTYRGCAAKGAVAVITSPRKTYRVTLEKASTDDDDPYTAWRGALRLSPSQLRNSDAGTWSVRYEVDGGTPSTSETTTVDGHVRRATRASFNAGPEPVKHDRLTFTGTLERADWNTHHYKPVSKPVIVSWDADGDASRVDVAETRTTKNGKYRTTITFPGAGSYAMRFEGGTVSAPVTSRADHVAQP